MVFSFLPLLDFMKNMFTSTGVRAINNTNKSISSPITADPVLHFAAIFIVSWTISVSASGCRAEIELFLSSTLSSIINLDLILSLVNKISWPSLTEVSAVKKKNSAHFWYYIYGTFQCFLCWRNFLRSPFAFLPSCKALSALGTKFG